MAIGNLSIQWHIENRAKWWHISLIFLRLHQKKIYAFKPINTQTFFIKPVLCDTLTSKILVWHYKVCAKERKLQGPGRIWTNLRTICGIFECTSQRTSNNLPLALFKILRSQECFRENLSCRNETKLKLSKKERRLKKSGEMVKRERKLFMYCNPGPAVQKQDSAIHRINRYLVDKCWGVNQFRHPPDS